MNLKEYFIRQQDILKSYYDTSNQFKASSDKGFAREIFVKDFLKKHLPKWLYFTRGEVICSTGVNSFEQDLVIYRPDTPHFNVSEGRELLFIEGVLSTIEVKTKIDKKELRRAMKNIANIKRMQRLKPIDLFLRKHPIKQPIRCLIFAYNGTKFKSIKKAFYEIIEEEGIKPSERPDFICVLGKYNVIKNDGFFLNKNKYIEDYNYIVKTSGDSTLLGMFLYLQYVALRFIGTSFEIKEYLPKGTETDWRK